MDSIRPAIPGVTSAADQAAEGSAPAPSETIGPSRIDDAAAAIAGVLPEPAEPDITRDPLDDETSDPEAFEPPLTR